MAQTIKDTDGKDIEVFTAAEVAEREAAALTQYQKDHPDQSAALTQAQTDLKAAKDALEAATTGGEGDDKNKNFASLRAAVKAAESKAETAVNEAKAEIEKIRTAPTKEYYSELVAQLGKGDKTLQEKIEIRYKELSGMPESNKAEVRARMEAAYKLADGKPVPSLLDGAAFSAAPRGQGGMPQNGVQENDNSRAIRGQLGITDAQAAKYAPKPGQPGYQG